MAQQQIHTFLPKGRIKQLDSLVARGDLIKLCQFIDKNPLGAAFTVEIEGKDDVIRT